jgi:hypothetical protein
MKNEEKEFLNSLPLFICTKNGKNPTEKQLKKLLKLLRKDFDKRNK